MKDITLRQTGFGPLKETTMPRLAAAPIILSDEQREELKAIVRKRNCAQPWVMRARIVLLAAEGVSVHETARRLGVWPKMVSLWRNRWLELERAGVIERLSDLPRPGTPAKYTPEQICAIVAIACERPEDCGRPMTHWTQQEIADEAVPLNAALSNRFRNGPSGTF